MSSEIPLPTVLILEDSPISAIPTSESAVAEENRILHLRMMEMWDIWANGKELLSVVPEFPELFPRDISHWHIWDDLARDFVRKFQYNIDIAPDRNSLSNLNKKSSECFREYAVKWREQAAIVKPPMDETEMVSVFLQAQEADYYQNMMTGMACTPNRAEPNIALLQSWCSMCLPFGAEGHDTDDCWTLKRAVENLIEQKRIVLKDEDVPNITNNPLPAHNNGPVIGMICEDREFDPALKAIIAIADMEKKPKAIIRQDKGDKKSKPTPQNTEKKVEAEARIVPSKDVVLYAHDGSPTVPWNYNKAVVTYKGKEISGEVKENNPAEKYLNLEEVNNATNKHFPPKKPVSAKKAETFFKKMKMADYEIIDQLRKSPAQVSLLSLLMNSTEHQKVLTKTLNEAYVPIETTVERLERMAEKFFAVNQISFSKNDLPPKRAAYNKALHLTVKCEGYYVKRVMLDGSSGVDICPLSTLQCMEIGTERIRPNNVCVWDMDTFYNFLLGRSWIHVAGAVLPTLHQMVKFKHEDQEIVVHGEDKQSIYRDPSVPCLEAREGSEHIVYQDFEIVVVDQCEEGDP
ncbi:uncharacterized protein LOC142176552 [Nicotiana tabacum]|uniref:Uncharacterized protein LOC142176552 n=1 Tax=Nicotiana tabacum TaxID=4097 RepID=A0AC58TTT9_TOBAC